jgi:hypothetical protein
MNTKATLSIINTTLILVMILILVYSGNPAFAKNALASTTASSQANQEIPSDWLAQAQEYIRQSEYRISWVEESLIPEAPASFQAPNRA